MVETLQYCPGTRMKPSDLAEAVRFELTGPCEPPVFKTGAIDHSATLPMQRRILGA